MRRKANSHRKPSAPVTMNAGRQLPNAAVTANTRKGATAPPIDDPESNSATAQPLSRRGNHSETAFVAPGQFAASPRPRQNRNTEKLRNPVAVAVTIAAIE